MYHSFLSTGLLACAVAFKPFHAPAADPPQPPLDLRVIGDPANAANTNFVGDPSNAPPDGLSLSQAPEGRAPASPLPPGQVPVLGLLAHATRLLGQTVRDQDQRAIGELQDLLVEIPGGEVHAGIVSHSGKRYAVPARAFFPAGETRVVFNAHRKLFADAPDFEPGTNGVVPKNALLKSFEYFAHKPPDPALGSAELHAASTLLGRPLRVASGQVLGQVSDLVVELSHGRTLYLLINSDPAADPLPVPPQLFQAGQGLQFTGSLEQLSNGPRLPSRFPAGTSLPEFAVAVYRYYGVPYVGPTRHAPSNTPTIAAHPALPMTGRTDAEVREAFLRAITANAAMPAAKAHDLRIQVQQGRIVLTGTVESEDHKRALLTAAQQAAGAANVVDGVRVR